VNHRRVLAVGRAIVNHREALEAEAIHGIAAERRTLLVVVRHQAKGGAVTLARVLDVGGHRQLRDAGVVIDARSRDRNA
jgi:hypothetical protein